MIRPRASAGLAAHKQIPMYRSLKFREVRMP